MSQVMTSEGETTKKDHLPREKELIEELSKIWLPHRRKDLEVRYQVGFLLNKELGPPTARQGYGLGTIIQIGEELSIKRSEVSRLRRFAVLADTFVQFEADYEDLKSWTDVREFLAAQGSKPKPLNDHRRSRGVLRTLKSVLEKFNDSGYQFKGSGSDEEICQVLKDIFAYAKKNLGVKFDD